MALYATGIYFIHPWIIYAVEHRFEMNTILLTGIVLLLAAAAARIMMAARRVGLPLF